MTDILAIIISAAVIGLIAWWFFGKQDSPSVAAKQSGEFQTVTVTVDGGYRPRVVSLTAGKSAKLTFVRKDPSSCLEEVIMPDFGVAEKLPVNQPHEITIQPDKTGTFTYTCGMRMFSGQIEVK